MVSIEGPFIPTELHPGAHKRNKYIVLGAAGAIAALAASLFAGKGGRPSTDEFAATPPGLLDQCKELVANPVVRQAFSEKLPNASISGVDCEYKGGVDEQSSIALFDTASKANITVTITTRELTSGGEKTDGLAYMREQIRLGRVSFKELQPPLPRSEATLQSAGRSTGAVIMYFNDRSLAVSYGSYRDTATQNFDNMHKTALELATVVAETPKSQTD